LPRTCTVCSHPAREAMDEALVEGVAFPALAAKYGVSKDSLSRHKVKHLPAKLVVAQAAEEVAQADILLDQVRDLQARAHRILDKAESAGDLRAALGAIREVRGNLELLAKLLGELQQEGTINLHMHTEWLELRAVIVTALEPHPEAKEGVLRAIRSAGNGEA
jgi:hypothetical protein